MVEDLKILILEDVPFDAELINRELERSGMKFSSRRVEEEKEYLNELNEFKPDIILADHSLPHFDGISALRIAKNKCPDVPFIFVSGKMGEDFAIEALKCGATDYVLKGSLSKIVHAVNRALEEVKEHSKRKMAEEALRNSLRQLKEAQKIGHIGSWEWDLKARELDCSDEFYNIMSLEPTEFGKSYKAMMDIIHPDDRQSVKESIMGAVNEQKPFSNDYRLIRPDGTVRILSSKGEVITDPNGKPLRIVGTEQDITEHKIAEEKIKSSLKDKEMLLQEIHHRVKNNLQVISSLLRLQSRFIKDQNSIDIFKETQNRVRSIAILHEKLYQSDNLAKIKIDEYVKILAEDLMYFYELEESNINMILDIDDVSLNIETAIPCGLLINEMVANSLKYAFPNQKNGEIKIELHSNNEDQFKLTVSDNGVGIPEEIDPEKAETFGMQLIKYLTKQLKGTIELDNNNGTKYQLKFNELKYKDRVNSNG
ncbi:histidine kinase dimerization/phosphoacceptor domain -containing protein [Methanobacterium spitsbergense]|uniref:PAS domain-containing protein n=1 Tax=Methanobacterium spitsbergense TaxID=2874285 RepID=A0A8T5UUI7_9EURY|nr:histidine kinase dimerization/phosphoacceptor domain -containing protein [Methanobacterium spitsbergense]MBZ2165877.1 PAS domain-containing protein [Methanobacterium spitsbergense]